MQKGLYVVPSDVSDYAAAWLRIISAMSDENTIWHVDCLDYCTNIPDFSGKNTPAELLGILAKYPNILFARMMATRSDEVPDREILVAADYDASNCLSIVICVDSGCFEVYSKDNQKLKILYEILSKENPFKLEWTGEDYGRIDFQVY